MDMKRILQALDGAATKSVAGANDMSKFLRIVDEVTINQPISEYDQITPEPGYTPAPQGVPPMPDVSDLQPGASKDGGQGSKITKNQDGTVSYAGSWGTHVYNAQGQHVKTDSPVVGGHQQTTNTQGQVTQQSYNQGPVSVQKGPQGTSAAYDQGTTTVSQQTSPQGQVTQQTVNNKPVAESSMSKFLSIISKNDVKVLNEGSNPHKVSLPVQMAMQHYAEPTEPVVKKDSLLKKYFAEAEEILALQQQEKSNIVKQYSQKIAKKVLMKESELKDKEDLKAKRKALQDIQLDPNTSKDAKLKSELAKRKADLEKEAKRRGLDEARLAPDQLSKLSGLKKQLSADQEAKRAADMSMTPEKQADVDQWTQDFMAAHGQRGAPSAAPAPKSAAPAPVAKKPEETLDLATLRTRIAILMKIEKLMQQKEKLMIRAEKFPGGIERGLASDLEMDYGNVEDWTTPDYEYALQGYQQQLEKLTSYIERKRAAWRKPKVPTYESVEQGRDIATIKKEIDLWEKQKDKMEYTLAKARKITTEIKYDNTATDIIVRVQGLITDDMGVDMRDFENSIKEVHEAVTTLQSKVYSLDDVFSEAIRSVKYKIDELESEIDEIHWKQRYGSNEPTNESVKKKKPRI